MIAFFDQVHLFIEQPTKSDLLFVKQMQNMVMNFIRKDEYSIASKQDADVLELKNLVDFKNNDLIKEPDLIKDFNASNGETVTKSMETRWLVYPKSVALVDQGIKIVKEYNAERCKFWQSIGLDRYAWVC